MSLPRHILVFRFSALGDVAMTIPVIKLVLDQNPGLRITYVSNAFVQPLFAGIERLDFYPADLKGAHKGIKGLYRLSQALKTKASFDAIADVHNVLRTKLLRLFFAPFVKKIAVIDKGRKEKAELTRIKNKKLHPLKTTFQRYADVFTKLGLAADLGGLYNPTVPSVPASLQAYKDQGYQIIGIAPFAKHAEKMYPLEKMKEVMASLAHEKQNKIFLFGSKAESEVLYNWDGEFENVQSLAGKMSLTDELEYISNLDLMVSMDSANMHLASLFGVPVVSVWGATHPFAGFYGWKQDEKAAVQVDLYCRPCSVFGNRKCFRGDHACMHAISPQMIYDRIVQELFRSKHS
jgi:ADP-heptose:LPS heptosyltransferase